MVQWACDRVVKINDNNYKPIIIIIGLAVHPWLNLKSFHVIPTSQMIFFVLYFQVRKSPVGTVRNLLPLKFQAQVPD